MEEAKPTCRAYSSQEWRFGVGKKKKETKLPVSPREGYSLSVGGQTSVILWEAVGS